MANGKRCCCQWLSSRLPFAPISLPAPCPLPNTLSLPPSLPVQLAEETRAQLARIEALLGADPAALRAEKGQLQACLERARSVLAKHTPTTTVSGRAGACGSAAASEWQDLGLRGSSPVPFALFGRLSSEGDLGGSAGAGDSPATAAAAASPDVFASPFLAASQTTLTVNYRDLQSDLRSSWRQQVGGQRAGRDAESGERV